MRNRTKFADAECLRRGRHKQGFLLGGALQKRRDTGIAEKKKIEGKKTGTEKPGLGGCKTRRKEERDLDV